MKEYLVIPENCKWYKVKAYTPNAAFWSEQCWFNTGDRIVIMDEESEQAFMYVVER